jgi:hypothetical protein
LSRARKGIGGAPASEVVESQADQFGVLVAAQELQNKGIV